MDSNGNAVRTKDGLKAVKDLYRFSIDHAKMQQTPNGHIAVETPSYLKSETPAALHNRPQLEKDRLLVGKHVDLNPHDANNMIFLLQPGEIHNLFLESDEIYKKLVASLEEVMGKKLSAKQVIADLKGLPSLPPDQLQERAAELRVRVNNIFGAFAESIFNGLPNVSISTTPEYGPIKNRREEHPHLVIRETSKGTYLEQVSYTKGDRRVLVKLDLFPEDATTNTTKMKPLLVAHALSVFLQNPEETVVPERSRLTRERVLKAIEKAGLVITPAAPPEERAIRSISNKKSAGKATWNTARGIAVLAAIAGVAGGTTLVAEKMFPDAFQTQTPGNSSNMEQIPSPTRVSERHKPAFPESVPQSHLDWKVEAQGDINPNGYYITSTSSSYFQGEFFETTRRAGETKIDVPSEIPFGDFLRITGLVGLEGKSAKFKLPVRNGTILSGLKISNPNDELIGQSAYSVIQLSDNTYEVDINLDAFYLLDSVKIEAFFEEAQNPSESVRAARRFPSLDTSKLDYNSLMPLSQSGGSLEGLAAAVAHKPYSINPENKDVLNSLDGTPEDFVEATSKLVSSDCDLSNSQFVLLSGTLATSDFVNLGLGYLHYSGNGSDTGSFLDARAYHAFAVNNRGEILDATANDGVSPDPMTQSYLNPYYDYHDTTPEDAWNKQFEDLKSKQQLYNGIMTLVEVGGGVAGAATALLIAKEARNVIKRNKKNIDRMRGEFRVQRALAGMSLDQTREAYSFFSWLSYGQGTAYSSFRPQEPNDRSGIVQKMRKGVLFERLREYIKNPKQFEEQAGIGPKRRIRRLANFLLSQK
jgi:hypothetical protein